MIYYAAFDISIIIQYIFNHFLLELKISWRRNDKSNTKMTNYVIIEYSTKISMKWKVSLKFTLRKFGIRVCVQGPQQNFGDKASFLIRRSINLNIKIWKTFRLKMFEFVLPKSEFVCNWMTNSMLTTYSIRNLVFWNSSFFL